MTFVMSDIHGDYGRFMNMLDKLAFRQGDRLYVVGDAIDRRADGLAILQFIRSHHNIELLLGNHEYMMREALSTGEHKMIQNWVMNGGKETMQEFLALSIEEQQDLLKWLWELHLSARVVVDEKAYHLTHGWPMDRVKETVWGRPFSIFQENPLPNCTLIIGHTPVCLLAKGSMTATRYLQFLESRGEHMKILHAPGGYIDIDCGCGHDLPSSRLAVLSLDTMEEFYI